MKMLEAEFQRAVSDYPKHSGMSGRKFGELALGDPKLVRGLKGGASPGLDAVDRMLRFMEIAPIDPRFRREVEAFLIVTGTSPTVLGSRAIGRSSFVRELGSGASPTLDGVERVRTWMHGAADDFQRRGIAWLIASDVTVPPYGIGAAFASWTEDETRIRKLDGTTFLPEREAAAVVGPRTERSHAIRPPAEVRHSASSGPRCLYARVSTSRRGSTRGCDEASPVPSDGARPGRMNASRGTGRTRSRRRGSVRMRLAPARSAAHGPLARASATVGTS